MFLISKKKTQNPKDRTIYLGAGVSVFALRGARARNAKIFAPMREAGGYTINNKMHYFNDNVMNKIVNMKEPIRARTPVIFAIFKSKP